MKGPFNDILLFGVFSVSSSVTFDSFQDLLQPGLLITAIIITVGLTCLNLLGKKIGKNFFFYSVERTDKIPLGSIRNVMSEPILGHEDYHIMVSGMH